MSIAAETPQTDFSTLLEVTQPLQSKKDVMPTAAEASENKAQRFLGYARNDKVAVMSTGTWTYQADRSALLEATAFTKQERCHVDRSGDI